MCGNACCLGSPTTQFGVLQGMLAQNNCKCVTFRPPAPLPLPLFAQVPSSVSSFVVPFGAVPFGGIVRIF
ncbi:hypothetical protein OMDBNIEC_00007 [Salmonella phage STP-SP5]|nr:hypothetical protein OMDBNIEC_00007 [Salmonella phage STP-SP5]